MRSLLVPVHALVLLLLLLRLFVATVVLRLLVLVFLFGRAGRFQGFCSQHCTLCIARRIRVFVAS